MRLKLIIISITAVAVVMITVFFAWRLKFLELPVRLSVQNLTGQNVSVGSIEYRLFNRVTLNRLTVGSNFCCEKVTVFINPLALLLHFRQPELSINSIKIDRPWINLNDELVTSLSNIRSSTIKSPGETGANISISWKDGRITGPYIGMTDFNGSLGVADTLTGAISGDTLGGKFTGDFKLKQAAGYLHGIVNADFSSPGGRAGFKAAVSKLSSGEVSTSFTCPELRWKNFSLKNSSGTFSLTQQRISAELLTSAGRLEASGAGFKSYSYSAKLDLSKIVPSMTGILSVGGSDTFGVLDGSVSARDCVFAKNALCNSTFIFKKDAAGTWMGKGSLQPNNIVFEAGLNSKSELLARFWLDKKETGRISGTVEPLDLKISFASFPAQRLPLPFSPRLRGAVSLSGVVTKNEQSALITAKNWTVDNGPLTAWHLRAAMINGEMTYDGASEKTDWAVSGTWKNVQDWNITAKLRQYDLRNLSPLLPPDSLVGGNVTGQADYSATAKAGTANIAFENLAFGGVFEGFGKLVCRFTEDSIDLKEFSLHSRRGTLTAQAAIGRTSDNNDVKANLVLYNFPLGPGGVLANGTLKLNGTIGYSPAWKFTGNVLGEEFRIFKFPARRLKTSVSLSAEELELSNLQWEKLLSGNMSLNFKSKRLLGRIKAKNVELGNFLDSASGAVEGDVDFSGTSDNPEILVHYTAPALTFKDRVFSTSGIAAYGNKAVSLENAKIESGKDSVVLNGRVYPSPDLKGNISGISMDSVKQYFAVPFDLLGRITGAFDLTGDYKDPLFNLNFSGRDLLVSGHPISEVSGQVSVHDRVLKISNLLAKYSDSEFRLLKDGVVNLKSSTFNLKSNLRNVHIGPVDIFGNLSLSGSWSIDQSSNPAVSAAVNTDDIFLNQYHLEKIAMNIKYKDRTIAFLPKAGQDLQLSGYVDLNAAPDVRFQRLSIKYANESSLLLDGQVGPKNWDFTVSGKAISASAVSEILDLPVDLDGSTDMTLIGSGDLEKPRFEGSLNITDGSVSEIPFDNFNLQFSVRQDILTVIRARIVRKDQYSAVANGFSPFYLTQAARKRIEKNPIDITLGIEEGTLNLLSGFSKDIKSATGIIHAQMHVTGTLASPVTNGYLKVTDGEIDSKTYFSKLSKLNVDCIWKDSVLSINDFSGRIGNGTMRLNGSIVFNGLKPGSYNIVWQTVGKTGINISVPQLPIPSAIIRSDGIFTNLSQGEPRFQIKLTGKADSPLLSGWVELENTNFTYPSVLQKTGEESPLDSFLPKVSWDLELRTGKNSWYENQLIRANANGSIKLSGKGAFPMADGKIESRDGEINYLGTQMAIKQAVFEVVKDKCYIEGSAEGHGYGTTSTGSNMELDTITMSIDKTDLTNITNLNPRFTSANNPELSSQKAFQRLTGTDPDVYAATDRDMILRQGVVRLVDSSVAAPLANLLSRKAGMRVGTEQQQFQEPIKSAIPGNPTLPELLQGTKVTVSHNITPEMSLRYGMLFDQLQNNINNTDKLNLIHSFEVQYQFENNFLLKGQWEFENSNSMYEPDRRIMFEKVWRFGR